MQECRETNAFIVQDVPICAIATMVARGHAKGTASSAIDRQASGFVILHTKPC
jgi:hypothetical protein